ncbi:hypothetical protein AAFN88_10400 [Pelagibius sp. CAU 1746]
MSGLPSGRLSGSRNLPAKADYIYEPCAYFGRYHMDTLWFAPGG